MFKTPMKKLWEIHLRNDLCLIQASFLTPWSGNLTVSNTPPCSTSLFLTGGGGGHRQKEGGASQEANGGKQVILSHKLLVKQGSSNPTGKQELRGA